MRELFKDMDQDGSGTVTLTEVIDFLEDPKMGAYFHALGIEIDDTERLFNLLDEDGTDEISIDEFINGCLHLRGNAKSIDLYHLMSELEKIQHSIERMSNSPHISI
jgi:hypothetical protein